MSFASARFRIFSLASVVLLSGGAIGSMVGLGASGAGCKATKTRSAAEPSGPNRSAGARRSDSASTTDSETVARKKWDSRARRSDPAPPAEKRSAAANDAVSFKVIGGGMLHLPKKAALSGRRPTVGTGHFRDVEVIRSQKAFDAFVAQLPKKTITKGPGRPNPDPLLQKPVVDFKTNMVMIVYYDYMWKKPQIKSVTQKAGKLRIRAEFVSQPGIVQHAYGVGSYVAVTIKKTNDPVVLLP